MGLFHTDTDYSTQILGVFPLPHVGVSPRISLTLFSRRPDGQTSHCGITALCVASCGKIRAKNSRSPHLLDLSPSYPSVGCKSNPLTENHIMGCKDITRCRAIAKLTARCALYIGHSTLNLFTPLSLLCADLILNEFKQITFSPG